MLQLKMLRLSFFRAHLLSALIVINGVVASSSQTVCNERTQREFQECVMQLSEASKSQDFMFAHTEREIAGVCRKFQQSMECMNNFVNQCVPSPQKEQLKTTYAGVESVIHDLCTPGSSFREDFLKHAPCYKTTQAEQQRCGDKYAQAAKDISNERMSNEEKVVRSCCLMSGMTNCALTPVRRSCGTEAADFLAQTYERIAGPSMKLLCSNVEHDDSACSAASVVTMPFFFLLSVISIAVFIY